MPEVSDLVRTMSGPKCFEAVNPGYSLLRENLIGPLWHCMRSAVLSAHNDPLAALQMLTFPPAPEMITIRTPRAYPYSLMRQSGQYIVVDENLTMMTYQFANIVQSREYGIIINPSPFFNQILAERAFVVGNLKLSMGCFASRAIELEGTEDYLTRFTDPNAEARLVQRSVGQHAFVIGHELAHMFLGGLSRRLYGALRQKLLEFLDRGVEVSNRANKAEPGWDTAENIRSRIADNVLLLDECLCDALSVAAMINAGLNWQVCLISAGDAIAALRLGAFCDYWAPGRWAQKDHEALDGKQRDLSSRGTALHLLNAMWVDAIAKWGLGQLGDSTSRELVRAEESRHTVLAELSTWQPMNAYRTRVHAPDFSPTALDLLIAEASIDYEKARSVLRFDRPSVSPTDLGASRHREALERFEALRNAGFEVFPWNPFMAGKDVRLDPSSVFSLLFNLGRGGLAF